MRQVSRKLGAPQFDEANATIETITIEGAGDLDLTIDVTTDAIETIDASDATGDLTITVAAATVLAVTTGAGSDTIELGTTLAGNDEINGGAGDDTLQGTIGTTGTLRVNATNIETLDINFTAAGTLDLRDTNAVTTLDLSGSTAAMDVNQASALLTDVVFTADSNQDVDIDYAVGVEGTLTITIGDADDGDGEGVDVDNLVTDAATLAIAAIGDDANTFEDVTANSATRLTFSTSTEDGTLAAGDITADEATAISLLATDGDLTVGTYVDADTLATLTLTATGAADLTLGDVGDEANDGAGAAFALGDIVVTMGTGDLTLGTFDVSTDDTDGVALDTISITSAGESIQWADGGVALDGNSEDEDANLSLVRIVATADDLDLDVGEINAAEIDEVVITTSGEDGDATFDLFTATVMGSVTITTGEDLDVTITEIAANEVGDISLTAAEDAVVTLDDLDINGDIGAIEISGAGEFDIDITDADSVEDIDATGTTASSVVNIAMGVIGAAVDVTFGLGTNTYTASTNDDVITLADEAATDTIITGATAGTLTITNFEAGNTRDDVQIDITGVEELLAVNTDDVVSIVDTATAIAATNTVVIQTIAAGAFDMDAAAAGANILQLDGTFASGAAVTTALEDGGAFELTVGGLAADDGFLILWDDGTDSYLSLVETADTDGDGATIAANALSITDLIVFAGIADNTDLTANNFDAFV
jgi:hypothetical protein